MKLKLVLVVLVAVSATVQAQQAKPRESPDDQTQSVTNEDRGRAYIISGDMPPLFTPGPHDKVIAEPQQNSIFLGRGWEATSLRAREPELANLLAHVSDQSQLSALNERGITNFFAPTSSQETSDDVAGDHLISDLAIQSVLAGMLKEGSLQRPNASAIYVIFLDPALHSTLGTMIASKHYLAYHNFFNASGVKVHYVVVPFEANHKTAFQIALRAFLAAVLNPNGTGSQ
jgi:hypothetical protein